jgi:histidine triad (HIT) family protein
MFSRRFLSKHSTELSAEEYCAFCNEDVLNRQKFYEDDFVFALYTHKPVLPGHCLIIPKRHVQRFEMLTDEEMTQIGRVIKKVNQAVAKVFNTPSYLILQKNGSEVGQSVPHVHFHYIPRQKGDSSTLKFLVKMYISNLQKPLSAEDMQKRVAELKEAMASSENP